MKKTTTSLFSKKELKQGAGGRVVYAPRAK